MLAHAFVSNAFVSTSFLGEDGEGFFAVEEVRFVVNFDGGDGGGDGAVQQFLGAGFHGCFCGKMRLFSI